MDNDKIIRAALLTAKKATGGKIDGLAPAGKNLNGVPEDDAVKTPLRKAEYPYNAFTPAKHSFSEGLIAAVNKAHAEAKEVDLPIDQIVTDVSAVGRSKLRSPATGLPFVERIAGVHHLRDGNHRVASAMLRGEKTVRVKVADMDEAIKANGRGTIQKSKGGFIAGNHPDVPEKLFHGTRKDFSSFYPMSHFGTELAANMRLDGAMRFHNPIVADKAHIMPVHLSMKNPLDVGREDDNRDRDSWSDNADMFAHVAQHLHKAGKPEQGDQLEDLAHEMNRTSETPEHLKMGADIIRSAGYDGIKYKNAIEHPGSVSYVALDPTQIKSAVGNRGTFDPNDPDITKAEGGAVLSTDDYLKDETGQPMKLYHGTSAKFDAFDPSKIGSRDAGFWGRGHYLTPDDGMAEDYAGDENGENPIVMGPMHAALKKPFVWDVSSKERLAKTKEGLKRLGIDRGDQPMNPWDNLRSHEVDRFTRAAIANGHDGVIYKTANHESDTHDAPGRATEIVVFKPEAIKHASVQQPDFTQPNIYRAAGGRTMNRLGMYSKAAEVAQNLPQLKGTVDQMLAMLKKAGVKDTELNNAGRPTGDQITRDDLAQHFNKALPDVRAHQYGDQPSALDWKEQQERIGLQNRHIHQNRTGIGKPQELSQEELSRLNDLNGRLFRHDPVNVIEYGQEDGEPAEPIYSDYKLPGGTNYRERLLTLPKPQRAPMTWAVAGSHHKQGFATRDEAQAYADRQNELREKLKQAEGIGYRTHTIHQVAGNPLTEAYHSSHWKQHPNVLAHIRLQDREVNMPHPDRMAEVQRQIGENPTKDELEAAVDNGTVTRVEAGYLDRARGIGSKHAQAPKGEKALHVEELQSDWAQEGRKQGFKPDWYKPGGPYDEGSSLKEASDHLNDTVGRLGDTGMKMDEIQNHPDYVAAKQKFSDVQNAKEALPSAPYVKNTAHWTDLALKNVLAEAAHGRYDHVVFTGGQEQADRYGLQKRLSRIEVRHPHGADKPDGGYLFAYGRDGNQAMAAQQIKDVGHLSDLVGGDVARKIMSADPVDTYRSNITGEPQVIRTVTGDDLKMGGEGMTGYYDNILPKAAMKLVQQHDPSIKPATIDGKFGFSMTPKARDSILKGQPAFAAGGYVAAPREQLEKAVAASPAAVTLSKVHPHTKAYKMPDKEVYFGLHHGVDYGKDYGFHHPELTDHEVGLTSVVNNEPGLHGVTEHLMKAAIENGATALDAFAVPNDKHPNGLLPDLYAKHGFRELGRVPFDPKYVDAKTLDQMKKYWAQSGWSEEKHGMPSVAIMKRRAQGGEVTRTLEGFPDKVAGFGEVRPSDHIRNVARSYMAQSGLPYNPPTKYAKVDPQRAARIAKAFDQMKDDPQDPLTKASYAQMAKETMAQYQHAKKHGFKAEFWNPETQQDPYGATPRMATDDVQKNNHMWVYPTSAGYGSGITETDLQNNPLLADSGERWNGQPVTVNDIFRAVHDYYGHAKEGVGFRHDGEENAWRAHASMFSPLARMAMTTETRGQNSWLNFGPYGEKNRKARTEDTMFADQKIGILPHWVHHEGAEDFMTPSEIRSMAAHRAYHNAIKKVQS